MCALNVSGLKSDLPRTTGQGWSPHSTPSSPNSNDAWHACCTLPVTMPPRECMIMHAHSSIVQGRYGAHTCGLHIDNMQHDQPHSTHNAGEEIL